VILLRQNKSWFPNYAKGINLQADIY